jgi:archaellum component FlaC
MAVMREAWTDERLDDLNGKVDRGFEQVDKRFEQVDRRFEQVDRRFEQVDQRFDEVDRRIGGVEAELRELRGEVREIHTRFDAMQQTMILGFAAMTASVVGAVLVVQL